MPTPSSRKEALEALLYASVAAVALSIDQVLRITRVVEFALLHLLLTDDIPPPLLDFLLLFLLNAEASHALSAGLLSAQQLATETRYLDRPTSYCMHLDSLELKMQGLMGADEAAFKRNARMSIDSFGQLVVSIEHNPVFANSSPRPQAPVCLQLLLTLIRLGRFGNGMSVGEVVEKVDTTAGTALLWTDRCVRAVVDLSAALIRWPDPNHRLIIKRGFGSRSPFGSCVGALDGTHVVLQNRPALENGQDFATYKKFFGLNCLGVVDHDGRFIFIDVRWPGSAHDQRVLNASDVLRGLFEARDYARAYDE